MSSNLDPLDEVAHHRLCQVIGALSIEVATGLGHSRGSVLEMARQRYGIRARTKRAALRELRELYAVTYGRPSIVGARVDGAVSDAIPCGDRHDPAAHWCTPTVCKVDLLRVTS
jgi:hypothetical protein